MVGHHVVHCGPHTLQGPPPVGAGVCQQAFMFKDSSYKGVYLSEPPLHAMCV